MTSSRPFPAPPHRWSALVCALAGVVLFQFWGNANRGYIDTASLFYWWGFQWANPRSEMEHGWLVLGLSLWLFWRGLRRDQTQAPAAAVEGRSAFAFHRPLFLMLAGLALHILGYAVQQARLSILALLLFTWGVLALAGGQRWERAARFPLLFLLFAVPVNVLDTAGFWLRLWVIEASASLAQVAGIEVVRNGTLLFAPDGSYQYDVAAACSGVRSLMALMALALLIGYLSFRSAWRRGVILGLSFPLVYLGNVVRISAIVFAGEGLGQSAGVWVHDHAGMVVFVVVLGGLLAIVRFWERHWPEAPPPRLYPENGMEAGFTSTAALDSSGLKRWWVAGGVVLAVATGAGLLSQIGVQPLSGTTGVALASDGRDPVELPVFLGTEWAGRRAEVTAVERELLPPDTGYARKTYVSLSNPGKQVFLSIVLSGRDRTSIHRPELCLVGQGWTLLDAAEHQFRYRTSAARDTSFPATLLRVRREVMTPQGREVVPELVAYWFVSGDTVVATHWQRMLRDGWTRLRHLRADRWAYVLMQTDAREGEVAAIARMQEVLDHTLPVFQPVSVVR